ncbi:LysM peptidoglycan-binding domain-containing protein [Algicella marina]|uniref:LysM peptidoglycan-binding domain-containing protein n=1 Tax=Algicella marina TaxID=2683284 RepID=A0A6P1SZY6_9RHOB|nr:LysM peptidoglycan-binding domain-containing protein [Algicella marina]QHQ34766.1 LysM peptidoglycan-binding domain-containing protein [Algicella marina]
MTGAESDSATSGVKRAGTGKIIAVVLLLFGVIGYVADPLGWRTMPDDASPETAQGTETPVQAATVASDGAAADGTAAATGSESDAPAIAGSEDAAETVSAEETTTARPSTTDETGEQPTAVPAVEDIVGETPSPDAAQSPGEGEEVAVATTEPGSDANASAEDEAAEATAPVATSDIGEEIAATTPADSNDVVIEPGDDPEVDESEPSAAARPLTPDNEAPGLPEFDLVRVDERGGGVVAGRAEPGTVVRVMAGGSEIATAEADSRGEFVAFIQTPASNEGLILSLLAENQAGELAEGVKTVLLLPVSAEDGTEAAPAVLRKDGPGEVVRVTAPGGLGKVSSVTLDAITYDSAGAVVLSGRSPREQTIRIYVDGAAVKDVASRADGTWDAKLDEVEEGRYILRVDALAADGSVDSRVESPFQRVFPELAAQASLSEITVQPGNTLWVMAEERYGNGFSYTQIFAANRNLIRDPDLIYPGQIFSLPDAPQE